jgi:hypothetical protein
MVTDSREGKEEEMKKQTQLKYLESGVCTRFDAILCTVDVASVWVC